VGLIDRSQSKRWHNATSYFQENQNPTVKIESDLFPILLF